MLVKFNKPVIGWKARVGDSVDMPDDVALKLISQGVLTPVDNFEEELTLWGLSNLQKRDKELIKFVCKLFGGEIVDVRQI